MDSEGRFDCSNNGDVKWLHWVVGTEVIALEQLKDHFYDPGLLAKYVGFNKEPFRKVDEYRRVKLYPSVEASLPKTGDTKMTVRLTNQGGGLGRTQIFVNNKEFLADARGGNFKDNSAATCEMTVDLADAIVRDQVNRIRIITWNVEGYLRNQGLDLEWTFRER